MEIRTLTGDDWAIWREVRLRSLADAPDAFGSKLADWQGDNDREDRWRSRFDHVAYNAVAVADGRVVGTVGAMHTEDESVELISMWVAPEVRGTGAGETLIDAVMAWAELVSIATVTLAVRRRNAHAIALYGRAGFIVVGAHPDDPDENVMVRGIRG